jgi:hypothetical protein
MSKPRPRRRPADTEEHSLSVYDGARCLGHIIERSGACHATSSSGKALGSYATRKAASDAISAADQAGAPHA